MNELALFAGVGGGSMAYFRKSNMKVLDPCCGSRMMWFDKQDDRAVFGDIRAENHTLCDGRSLSIEPDTPVDFRSMPFDSGSFKLVVFDPPHLVNLGQSSWMAKKYGVLSKDWREDLRKGFAECFRVLEPSGVLIFKWNETQIKVSEILALTDQRPPVWTQKRQVYANALDLLHEGAAMNDPTQQAKIEVLKAALGISILDEPELFARLEELYWTGAKNGISILRQQVSEIDAAIHQATKDNANAATGVETLTTSIALTRLKMQREQIIKGNSENASL